MVIFDDGGGNEFVKTKVMRMFVYCYAWIEMEWTNEHFELVTFFSGI